MKVNAVIRILLIEDDEIASKTLGRFLENEGLYVEYEATGGQAVQHTLDMNPDAVVLDWMLPGKDGLQIFREVRRAGYREPILMLTARKEDLDQVLGLELGADDYITKPANPRVVLARLRSCLRRVEENAGVNQNRSELVFGQFRINKTTREVHLGENEIALTTAEFDLLWLLAISAGSILSRDQIQRGLRSITHDGIDRSIDMRISRLRKCLGDNTDKPIRIKTIRAKGYLFSPIDWD